MSAPDPFAPQVFSPLVPGQSAAPVAAEPLTPAAVAPSAPVAVPGPSAPAAGDGLVWGPAPDGPPGAGSGATSATDRFGRRWTWSPDRYVRQAGGDPRIFIGVGALFALIGAAAALGAVHAAKPSQALVLPLVFVTAGLATVAIAVSTLRRRRANAVFDHPSATVHPEAAGFAVPGGPPAYVPGLTVGPVLSRRRLERALARPNGAGAKLLWLEGYRVAPGDLPADPGQPATLTTRTGARVPAYAMTIRGHAGYWVGDATSDPGGGLPVVVNGRTVWAVPNGLGGWTCNEREVLDGSMRRVGHGSLRLGGGLPRLPDGYVWGVLPTSANDRSVQQECIVPDGFLSLLAPRGGSLGGIGIGISFGR